MRLSATAVDAVTRSIPCLLTSSDSDDQLSRGTTGSWSVKNTFVHVDPEELSDHDDEDMCLPIKSKSAPNIEVKADQVQAPLMLPLPARRHESASGVARIVGIELEPHADAAAFTAIATAPSPCRSITAATARTPRVRFDLTPKVCGADAAAAFAETVSVLAIPGEDGLRLSMEPSEKTPTGADAPQEATTPHLFPLSLSDSFTLGKVRVKNTFVHVVPDATDDIEEDLPTRSISMPSCLLRDSESPVAALDLRRHSSEPVATALAPPPGLPVAPVRASVGSALHGTGRCKPCAWFWKPQSCRWGVECGHCHECPEGELRRRKKEKIAGLKHEKQEKQSAVEEVLSPPE